MKKIHSLELEDLHSTLKRGVSSNFYATCQQEELGSKIFAMKNEMEELQCKHQMEIKHYQDKLGFITGELE